jgi:hypothetical protein
VIVISTTLGDVSQLLQAIFTGGLLLIAVVAAGFAWAQLRAGRQTALEQLRAAVEHEKRVRVYELVDRTTHLEFVALASDALAPFPFADVHAMEGWWRDPQQDNARRCLVTLLNFCEEIAGEYLDGILARSIADKNIAYVAASVWEIVAEFVDWFRKDSGDASAWEQLRGFADTWQRPPAAFDTAE